MSQDWEMAAEESDRDDRGGCQLKEWCPYVVRDLSSRRGRGRFRSSSLRVHVACTVIVLCPRKKAPSANDLHHLPQFLHSHIVVITDASVDVQVTSGPTTSPTYLLYLTLDVAVPPTSSRLASRLSHATQ